MNTPADPSHGRKRNTPAVLACALLGYAVAAAAMLLVATTALDSSVAIAVAYPLVFLVAAAGITLIFKAFVKR